MSDKPNPTRIYVATTSYISQASEQHLDPPGVVKQGMKLWGNHAVVLEHPEWWVDVADDPETAALATVVADQLAQLRPAQTSAERGGRPGASA